jgi:hypothetical protein
MICQHLKNGQCLVINKLSQSTFNIDDKYCKICTEDLVDSQGVNKVTVSISLSRSSKERRQELLNKYSYLLVDEPYGPGTELAKLVSWFKFSNKKCNCAHRIRKMNRWGPDECEKRQPTIRRWLRHSAYLNGVPFNTKVVDVLIDRAIKNARIKLGRSSSDGT